MVKRAKSPEIIEEVRYFTVCQPFPLNANWLFPEDQKDCATWIAECIGLQHLYGIHHKPSARPFLFTLFDLTFTHNRHYLGSRHDLTWSLKNVYRTWTFAWGTSLVGDVKKSRQGGGKPCISSIPQFLRKGARCSERRFVIPYTDVFLSRSYLLPNQKDGKVLLSTRVGSRIGLQEKGKQL